MDVGNHHWATAGRIAYFRARLKQQKGDTAAATADYAAIVREHPMQFSCSCESTAPDARSESSVIDLFFASAASRARARVRLEHVELHRVLATIAA